MTLLAIETIRLLPDGVRDAARAAVQRETGRTDARAAQPTEVTRQLAWSVARSGLWTARIGLDQAGTIERRADGFAVFSWSGELEGTYGTLDDAQLSLEPEARSRARAAEDAKHARMNLLASSAIMAGSVIAGLAVVGWTLVLP